MRLLGQLLLVALIISAVQGLLALIAAAFLGILLMGLIWRPKETWGMVAFFGFLSALQANPVATMGVIGTLLGLVWVADRVKADRLRCDDTQSAKRLPGKDT